MTTRFKDRADAASTMGTDDHQVGFPVPGSLCHRLGETLPRMAEKHRIRLHASGHGHGVIEELPPGVAHEPGVRLLTSG